MKNKVRMLAFFIITFIAIPLVINSDVIIDIGSGGGGDGQPRDCRMPGSCVASNIQSGLRVSVYTKQIASPPEGKGWQAGMKIGNTVDYLPRGTIIMNENFSHGVRSVSIKRSKVDYVINKTEQISINGGHFTSGFQAINTRNNIPKTYNNVGGVRNYFEELGKKDSTGKRVYEAVILNILNELGITGSKSNADVVHSRYYILENMDKYYWVVEPVMSFRIAHPDDNKLYTYMLTPTEIALFLNKSKYSRNTCYSEGEPISNTVYCRIVNIERFIFGYFPNSLYINNSYPELGFKSSSGNLIDPSKGSPYYSSAEVLNRGLGVGVVSMHPGDAEETCETMDKESQRYFNECLKCEELEPGTPEFEKKKCDICENYDVGTPEYLEHCRTCDDTDLSFEERELLNCDLDDCDDCDGIIISCDDLTPGTPEYYEHGCASVDCSKDSRIGRCTSSTQTNIVETNNWNACIYNNSEHLERTISYCNVYCREEVGTDLQSRYPTVMAGHHFTLNGMSVYGLKECRAIVNLTALDNAINSAISNVRSAFTSWQYELAMDKIGYKENGTCDGECEEYIYTCPDGGGLDGRTCKGTDEEGNDFSYAAKPGPCKKYKQYTYYSPDKSSVPYKDSYGITKTASKSGYCSYRGSSYVSKSTSAYSTYISAIQGMDRAIANVKSCADWTSDIGYNLNPELSIVFDYLGQNRVNMEKGIAQTSNNTFYTLSGNSTSRKTEDKPKISCSSGSGCTINYESLPWNEVVGVNINKFVSFFLPDNAYRYVDKVTTVSSSVPSANGLSYDIGRPNIPVHHTTLPGWKNITLEYSGLGEGGKFDWLIGGVGQYQCSYGVVPGITPPPDEGIPGGNHGAGTLGYKFVYRTIELDNPFPGKDGKGRPSGTNWIGSASFIDVNTYSTKPKYQIVLDSAAIREIRKHNKVTPYDDFNMVCKDGYKCESNFLKTDEMKKYITIDRTINYNAVR